MEERHVAAIERHDAVRGDVRNIFTDAEPQPVGGIAIDAIALRAEDEKVGMRAGVDEAPIALDACDNHGHETVLLQARLEVVKHGAVEEREEASRRDMA